MLKILATASLFFASTLGMTAMAVAQTIPPFSSIGTHHVLPDGVVGYPGYRLQEGRSIYRMEPPSTFYYGTDERGDPSGEPQNPRTGD
jgi:hypothetical protein